MNNKLVLAGIAVLVVMVMVMFLDPDSSTQIEPEQPADYLSKVQDYHKEVRSNLLSESIASKESEISFYPISDVFRKVAQVLPPPNRKERMVKTTKGNKQAYIPKALFQFEHQGESYKLLGLEPAELDDNTVYIFFTDASRGEGTYPGGRYLEVIEMNKDQAILDFNRAYNPYCAYDEKYDCPIPDRSNHLPFKVLAGARYQED